MVQKVYWLSVTHCRKVRPAGQPRDFFCARFGFTKAIPWEHFNRLVKMRKEKGALRLLILFMALGKLPR